MSPNTKRPKNKCKECGYAWYPRGNDLSIKCPKCGSEDTTIKGWWLGYIILFVILYWLFG